MQNVPVGGALLVSGRLSAPDTIVSDGLGVEVKPAVEVKPDRGQIDIFLREVFGHCDGMIPLRGIVDQGQGIDAPPHHVWIDTSESVIDSVERFAIWASGSGAAVYVIPGTVAERGQARAADVRQMQAVVVDLDAGDIDAKLGHLVRHLGQPTMLIESGGRTAEGADKLHVWWRLSEPAEGRDVARVCRARGDIAHKVGGDIHFASAHQPIRVAGTVYRKGGRCRIVTVRQHAPEREVDLEDFVAAVACMPALPGAGADPPAPGARAGIDAILTTPVRAGGEDAWTRFSGASAAIGHYVRLIHDGRLSAEDGWAGICEYNAAMLRPPWPLDRLRAEADAVMALHVRRNGPPVKQAHAPLLQVPSHTLGALLDDATPMPVDLIGPRVLTPGGVLVLGGAPKVGKSDFLLHLLIHAAAGEPFLDFQMPRPLRVFYLQAEIQYHYLRERIQQVRADPRVIERARDTLAITPKLRLLLDEAGVASVADAILRQFPDAPPDVICIDPIRNLFDGGPAGEGENNNDAMMFFLRDRIESLRDAVAPEAAVILAHHTKKMNKQQIKEDPFLSFSGASALRGYYSSGMIMFRPDESLSPREIHLELRNGPALPFMIVDKRQGAWVKIDATGQRLVRQEAGARLDAERNRRGDAILDCLASEAAHARLYTASAFAAKFENALGLGGKNTIIERIDVLAAKGYVKFSRSPPAGVLATRSKRGYLVTEGMRYGPAVETADPETGEVTEVITQVLPTHYQCSATGALLPVEDPRVWVLHDPERGAL